MRVDSPSAFYTAVQSRAVDAAAMDRMQARLAEEGATLFGADGVSYTAFVCPDKINKLAIEHFG